MPQTSRDARKKLIYVFVGMPHRQKSNFHLKAHCYHSIFMYTHLYLPKDAQLHQQSSKGEGEFVLVVTAGIIHLDI